MTQVNSVADNDLDVKPWYREFWFWVIAAPIIAVFVMAPITLFLAISGKDELVKGDYEKKGRMYYQTDDDSTTKSQLGNGSNGSSLSEK